MSTETDLTQEILRLLSELGKVRKFVIVDKFRIRDEDGRCPLCALAHFKNPEFPSFINMWNAARELNLDTDEQLLIIRDIAAAADNYMGEYSSDLTKQLAEALGVKS